MNFDAAVVGAGIVGAACAREAAEAGLQVVVIERDFPACGATGAGMGHVVAMDDSEPQFALTRFGRELWSQLAPTLPADCEYVASGTLWVAADENEFAEVLRKQRFYSERGVRTEVLDPRQLQRAEPNLREGLAGALLIPDDAVLYPPCATRFLLQHPNIHLRNWLAVSVSDTLVKLADGSTASAGLVINAAGTEAGRLSPQLPIPIQPRKGHLLITDRYPGFIRHQLVELGYLKSAHSTTADSVAFNVQPRANGQILIGSSRQFGETTAAMDRHVLSSMLARTSEYLPGIERLSAIRGWTGFRAATPDKLPLIGLVPGSRSLYVAAGHEGLGITTALATGRLLLDRILQRVSVIPATPYSAERPCLTHA